MMGGKKKGGEEKRRGEKGGEKKRLNVGSNPCPLILCPTAGYPLRA